MIKGIMLISAMVLLLAFAGCNSDEDQMRGDNFQGVDNGVEDWCSEGSIMNIEGDSGAYKVEVLGVRDSGEYEGMCHYRYVIDSESDSGVIDYYVDKDGNGYQVVTMNGETTKVAWSAGE